MKNIPFKTLFLVVSINFVIITPNIPNLLETEQVTPKLPTVEYNNSPGHSQIWEDIESDIEMATP